MQEGGAWGNRSEPYTQTIQMGLHNISVQYKAGQKVDVQTKGVNVGLDVPTIGVLCSWRSGRSCGKLFCLGGPRIEFTYSTYLRYLYMHEGHCGVQVDRSLYGNYVASVLTLTYNMYQVVILNLLARWVHRPWGLECIERLQWRH